MCGLGDHVEYRRYPGRDHETVVSASFPLVRDWVEAWLHGEDAPDTFTRGGTTERGNVRPGPR